MKNYSVLLIALAWVAMSCETQKTITDVVYKEYNQQAGFAMWVLPPSFVDNFVDESETEQQQLLQSVRDFRLMIFDNEVAGKSKKTVYADVKKLLDKRDFVEYLSIAKEGSQVTMMAKEKKGTIREMHVLVSGDEKLFMASLTGRIDFNTVNSTLQEIDFDEFSEIGDFSGDFDFDDFEWAF